MKVLPLAPVSLRIAGVAMSLLNIAPAQSYDWQVFAGPTGGSGTTNGTGSQARFSSPSGVVVTAAGDLLVAESGNHGIRKVTAAGVVTSYKGTPGVSGTLFAPQDLGLDAAGNLFVVQSHAIFRIAPGGSLSLVAGGTPGYQEGWGTSARFQSPTGLAINGAGTMFVADRSNHRIRVVYPNGFTSTFAGGSPGALDGTGTAARFQGPTDVALDASGNLFVSESLDTIRKITPAGVVTTFAGTAYSPGSTDGNGTAARFNNPAGLAFDGSGNLLVADVDNHVIRKITPVGEVTTLAGLAGVYGSEDGSGSAARFCSPTRLTVGPDGTIYVSDASNHAIRKVTSEGEVTTLAGFPGGYGSTDGAGTAARFHDIQALAVDSSNNAYVADSDNHVIRKVSPTGEVTTLAGAAGISGTADGNGAAARFDSPAGVAVDGEGNVYVGDSGNHTVRKITPAGDVTTLAGLPGTSGRVDGIGTVARFENPSGVAVDGGGTVFVADEGNSRVRKISTAGEVTTVPFVFKDPRGLAMGNSGEVYVAEEIGHVIRKISPAGEVTLVAGGPYGGTDDGPVSYAKFMRPYGLAVDASGAIFVADTGNQTIRRISTDGMVTTVGGKLGIGGTETGVGSSGRFRGPAGIAVYPSGEILVGDSASRLVKGVALTAGEEWRQLHFGIKENSGDAADDADPDGDGWSNAKEYISGTLPLDRASFLRVTAMTPEGEDYLLDFPSVVGRRYGVEYSEALEEAAWQPVLTNGVPAVDIEGTGGLIHVTDTGGAEAGKRFYRIRVGM